MAVGIVLKLFAHQIKEEGKKKVTNNFKLFFNKKKPNIIEGDSAVVINAISQGNDVLSAYGNIIDYILCHVVAFQFFEFCQVHRRCNFVADALAKKANHLRLQVWLEDMPEDIAPFSFI